MTLTNLENLLRFIKGQVGIVEDAFLTSLPRSTRYPPLNEYRAKHPGMVGSRECMILVEVLPLLRQICDNERRERDVGLRTTKIC